EGLGRLADAHRGPRVPDPARGGRPLRHQPRDPGPRDPGGRGQCRPRESQPDRYADRDPRLRVPGHPLRLHLHDEPPQRRDRGRHDRRPRGGDRLRPDQDRLALPHRPRRQIQSTAAYRGGAGSDGEIPGPVRPQPAAVIAVIPGPVVLMVLDGFGCRAERKDNAIALARMPALDGFKARYPHTTLAASERRVACPTGRWATRRSATSTWGRAASSTWTPPASPSPCARAR